MAKQSRLRAGCRVRGSHGQLINNPDPNIKRRVRKKVVGTVIKASGPKKWIVVFDFDGREKEIVTLPLQN